MPPQTSTLLPIRSLPPLYQFTRGPWCATRPSVPLAAPLLLFPISVYHKCTRFSGPSSNASYKAFPSPAAGKRPSLPFRSRMCAGHLSRAAFQCVTDHVFIDALRAPHLSRGVHMPKALSHTLLRLLSCRSLMSKQGGRCDPSFTAAPCLSTSSR